MSRDAGRALPIYHARNLSPSLQGPLCPLCLGARWYLTARVSCTALDNECHTVDVAQQQWATKLRQVVWEASLRGPSVTARQLCQDERSFS